MGGVDGADAATKRKAWNGKTCTIVGTAGKDVLKGTAKNDVICGLGGNDVITGLGGNDTIDGGAGNDTIDAGKGADVISGGSGNDKELGAAGNDTLLGGAGNDSLDGGAGADVFDGGTGINPCKGNGKSWDAGDVFDVATCEDVTAPEVVSASISPDRIDTRTAAASYTITIRIKDNLSGFPACSVDGYTGMNTFLAHSWANKNQTVNPWSTAYPVLPGAENTSCAIGYGGNTTSINEMTSDGRITDITAILHGTVPRFSAYGKWTVTAELGDMTSNRKTVTLFTVVNVQ